MKRQRKILLYIISFFLALLLACWVNWAWQKILDRRPSHGVVVRLKWLHQAQFAGLYWARENGLYEANGLKTALLPFDYKNFPIDEVAEGKADFGVTGADELLLAREQGKKIKALAVIFQKSPVVAYSLESSSITAPYDFLDRRLGVETGVNVEYVIKMFLAKEEIPLDRIEVVPIGFSPEPLLRGEVDIATGYAINEPLLAEEAGYKVNVIDPSKYGLNLYADVLFTSEELIERDPDLVEAFTRATLEGWEAAIASPEKAVNFTLQYSNLGMPPLNFEHEKNMLLKAIPFIKSRPGLKVGDMNYISWQRTQDFLEEAGLMRYCPFTRSAYTVRFLGFNE